MIICPVVNDECIFAVDYKHIDGIYCGQGKGDSNTKDIKSCNRKKPSYSSSFMKKLREQNERVRLKERGLL